MLILVMCNYLDHPPDTSALVRELSVKVRDFHVPFRQQELLARPFRQLLKEARQQRQLSPRQELTRAISSEIR